VPESYGKHLWNTGPNPTYKFGDQWVVSDRLLVDVTYAHIGNNFTLGFHSPELADVQPTFIIPTTLNGRSAASSVFIRPVNSLTVNSNYFMPAVMGSDHAFKFGGTWHDPTARRSTTPATDGPLPTAAASERHLATLRAAPGDAHGYDLPTSPSTGGRITHGA
jgi:hypothetical protein